MVLPFRQSFFSSSSLPETSSRVSLASLANVFQTKKMEVTRFETCPTIILSILPSKRQLSPCPQDSVGFSKSVSFLRVLCDSVVLLTQKTKRQ